LEELKLITAANIINLRMAAGMTQAELAAKLNYSDKSVSKWERAEAIPDAYVLKQIAAIFGVTVDWLLQTHDGWQPQKASAGLNFRSGIVVTIAVAGIWTLALLAFIIGWLSGLWLWQVFVWAAPVSLITMLVLNSVWRKGRLNTLIVGALAFSVLLLIYCSFWQRNWWQLFILVIPVELVVFLSSRIKKKPDQK